jgi:general stress protein YciG
MGNTSNRGFASMDNAKQREIASKGGRAAHVKGTAHEWSSDEARAAGRKGGEKRGSNSRPLIDNSSDAYVTVDELRIGAREAGNILRTGSQVLEAVSQPADSQSGNISD